MKNKEIQDRLHRIEEEIKELKVKLGEVAPPQAESQEEIWNDCLSLIDTLAREVDDEFGLPMYEDPKGNTIQENIMEKFTITRKAKP